MPFFVGAEQAAQVGRTSEFARFRGLRADSESARSAALRKVEEHALSLASVTALLELGLAAVGFGRSPLT